MTPNLYEMYEKELKETIKEGNFSSYIPKKKTDDVGSNEISH